MSVLQNSGAVPVVAPAQVTPSDQPASQYTMGNESVELLAVDPWGGFGFGCVNPGDETCFTQNSDLWDLADEVGLCHLLVAMDPDMRGWEPPGAFVARRVASMFNRAKTLLNGMMVIEGDAAQRGGMTSKQDQSARAFLLHPCPYFKGPMVKNKWLEACGQHTMRFLSNLMQHPSNRYGSGVTAQCVLDLQPYLDKIALVIGVQLCGLASAAVLEPKFLFDLSDGATGNFTKANYTPSQLVINKNALFNQGATLNVPTLEDIAPMVEGIPANICVALLAQYPKGPLPQAAGMQGDPLLSRDAVLGYASAQKNAMPTARDTLVNAINGVIQQAATGGNGAAPQAPQTQTQTQTQAGAAGTAAALRDVPGGAA